MKTIKKIDVGRMTLYGAVLAAFWTLVYGIVFWILGWIFGAQSWFIDMNLGNWAGFTFQSFLAIIIAMLFSALAGAIGGLVLALVYNAVAAIMGGIKIELE